MIEDRELVINGISYHERRLGDQLIFRFPNLFEPEKHLRYEEIKELTYPKEEQ